MKLFRIVTTGFLFFTQIDFLFPQTLAFPKYTDVVEHFFNTTSLINYKDPVLNFQKKPSGWYAELAFNDNDSLLKIWDSDKQYYLDTINKPDSTSSILALRNKTLDNWEKIHFDACPYFGYKGWNEDVIKEFGNYKGDSAEIIYGIGRAYSLYADDLLSNKSGWSDSSKMFPLKNINDKLSGEQLKTYRQYRHTAIDLYSKVISLKPSYQTLVGEINLKRDFEYLTAYLDLILYSTKEEALKEIPNSLFSPFYREFAYNLLMSCGKNAILFVNGDLDTFLPIYLQQKEGIRQDVIVINTGMLALPQYCNYLRKTYHLEFALKDANTDQSKLAYAFLQNDSTLTEWTADKVFKYINDSTNKLKYQEYFYLKIPTNHFSIKDNKYSIEWNSEAEYLYKYQLVIADIIYSNLKHHPVYFAITNSSKNLEGYEHNLLQQALTYKLTNDFQVSGSFYDNIDTEKSYQLVTKTFHWNHAVNAVSHEKMLCMNYRLNLSRLANKLVDDHKPEEANEIIKLCLDNFGNEHLAFDYSMLPIIEAYYKMKKYEKGNQIAKTIVYNYIHDIEPLDEDIVMIRSPKDEKLIDNVREVMRRFSQDETILESN